MEKLDDPIAVAEQNIDACLIPRSSWCKEAERGVMRSFLFKSNEGLAPKIPVRPRIQLHRSSTSESFVQVLQRPLPFKIPVINKRHVIEYPEVFEFGEGEYRSALDTWIECFGGSTTSELTVIANDMLWQKSLLVLCHLAIMLNEQDPSSEVYLRPSFTALHLGTLVLKCEANCGMQAAATAIRDLADRLHRSARLLFPKDCPEIPGIATSLQGASVHRIYYANRAFHEELVKTYQFHTEHGRVEFLCDIFKIALWISSQVSPVSQFHLPPDVRIKTRNGHHITLTKNGLVKEFHRGRNYAAAIAHIRTIYEARLPNVEQGITNSTSITITTVGCTAKHAIHLHGLEIAAVLAGVSSAVAQLHAIGMAHCDICMDNVFVDLETNVVFLGDLEYCRPMGDAPPANIRRGEAAARTAADLDDLQLAKLRLELMLG